MSAPYKPKVGDAVQWLVQKGYAHEIRRGTIRLVSGNRVSVEREDGRRCSVQLDRISQWFRTIPLSETSNV